MSCPIAISLSPNAERDDVVLALKTLMQPWMWRSGEAISAVEQWFRNRYSVREVASFNSGRSALYALLRYYGIGTDDEVMVQAFTCVAVPEVVMWVGAQPVYVDIQRGGFNMDLDDAARKITKKTKAIIVQHTFGIPAEIYKLRLIAQQNNLILIEDCAHSLGATVHNQKIGSFGDASFFSFGRDKIISSVFGGVAIINKHSRSIVHTSQSESESSLQSSREDQKQILKPDITKAKTGKQVQDDEVGVQIDKDEISVDVYGSLTEQQQEFPHPSSRWIMQQLFHPLAFAFILPLYAGGVGKLALVVLQKLRLISFPVYSSERVGKKPKVFPKKLPNALAVLARQQLDKLERFNQRRVEIAQRYGEIIPGAAYLRYPVLVNNPVKMYQSAKQQGVLLGRWYSHVIDPKDVDLKKVGYVAGSCPQAEYAAKYVLNLPTYPTMTDADVGRVQSITVAQQPQV